MKAAMLDDPERLEEEATPVEDRSEPVAGASDAPVDAEPEIAPLESTDALPPAEPLPVGEDGIEGDGRAWYVVHCYSGQENKVRHNLEQRIETMGMKDKIFDIIIPTIEEIEVKDGKRRTVEKRVYPGYLMVQMILSEESWFVVRNTPGVTGFVGMGNTPTALRTEEVAQILHRMETTTPTVRPTYKSGQKVRIVDGPFNEFVGTVEDIDMDRGKVRVLVSFFGRETPVELDFLQVEKT
jgi:transcription termination/antitermination protein NusG